MIQWLFPLPEPSGFNAAAPLLTRPEAAAIAATPALRAAVLASFARMLAFYGYALNGTDITPLPSLPARAADWTAGHNLLRITRILRSLALTGLVAPAAALLARLEALPEEAGVGVPATSVRYWRTAATSSWPGGD